MTPARRRPRTPFPWHVVVFLLPAVLIYTAFMIYPLVNSLRLSLYGVGLDYKPQFVGLDNYAKLLTSEQFAPQLWNALRNNLVFFAVHMLVQNPVGLFLAVLLNTRVRGSVVYRTLIFTPTVLSVVLIGFAWRMILSPLWGISSGIPGLNLMNLGLEQSALLTVSLISVWQYVGIPMMLFLAALVGIPAELLEAARTDGAGAWSVFWRIQFPLILPTVGIVAVLTFVGNFNAFDLVYATQGALAGPDFHTDLLGTLFYRVFFGFQLLRGDPNLGAAVAGVMLGIILTGVLVYLFAWQRRLQRVEF